MIIVYWNLSHIDTGSLVSNLIEINILINSTIFDANKGEKILSCDLKNFSIASPMENSEYMRLPIKYVQKDIIQRYKLNSLVKNGCVYVKIMKGIYGLK